MPEPGQSSDNYVYAAIPPNLVDVMWPLVAPHIQRVVDIAEDEITMDSVRERSKNGDSTIAVVSKSDQIIAIFTIEIREFDSGKKALYLPIIAGSEFFNWMPGAFKIVGKIAREAGCFEIRGIAGRNGWMRKMKNFGWRVVHEVIAVDLPPEE